MFQFVFIKWKEKLQFFSILKMLKKNKIPPIIFTLSTKYYYWSMTNNALNSSFCVKLATHTETINW